MAAPTLDAVGSSTASTTNAITFGFGGNNTAANSIICMASFCNVVALTAPTITSITGGSLTWSMRKFARGNALGNLELWWALAATNQTGVTFTANYSGLFDDASAIVFSVAGCKTAAPWDSNGTISKSASSASNPWTPSFTGITTTEANDFLIFLAATDGSWSQPGTLPSGYTIITSRSNSGGSHNAVIAGAYLGVTSTQSNVTSTWGSSLANPYPGAEAIFDALTADSAPPSNQRSVYYAT